MKKDRRRTQEGIGLKGILEKVPKHHHCPVCGMPISLDRETCSKECAERFRKVRRARYQVLIPFVILIATIAIFVIRWLYQL